MYGSGALMSLSGNLRTMDLAELLQWVALGRKTGSLTFARNKIKIFIFFKDGQIISSRSNEPTRQLGHYLLFQGKITETQLKRALELQLKNRLNLGRNLIQQGHITQQEVEKALGDATERLKRDFTDEALEEQQRLIAAQHGLRERLASLAGTD